VLESRLEGMFGFVELEHIRRVLGLHEFVVRCDDGFFAVEVMVRRADRHVASTGDVAHGGGVEALFAKELERGLENASFGGFRFRNLALGFFERIQIEHVQNLLEHVQKVKWYPKLLLRTF
jgi:hypothetical protein